LPGVCVTDPRVERTRAPLSPHASTWSASPPSSTANPVLLPMKVAIAVPRSCARLSCSGETLRSRLLEFLFRTGGPVGISPDHGPWTLAAPEALRFRLVGSYSAGKGRPTLRCVMPGTAGASRLPDDALRGCAEARLTIEALRESTSRTFGSQRGDRA